MFTAETEDEQIARKIRTLIKSRGSSEAHVIKALGIHHVTYEKRMRNGSFTADQLRIIAKALGASIWDVLPDTWIAEHKAAA